MKINYMKRGLLLFGAAALATSSLMAEETAWRNVNYLLEAPSFVKGWSGNFSAINEGLAENYNGAFEAYQVVPNLKAGKYTLTVNAFYRYSNNDESKANMADGANHNAYIFLGSAKATVKGLFDEDGETPNSLADAKVAFEAGKYLNTVEYTLESDGDLVLGIGNLGGRQDEWTAFDNFKLVGPEGEVALVNGDFEDVTLAKEMGWDFNNHENLEKLPDIALKNVQTKEDKQGEYNGAVTGVFRKTNASVYNFGVSATLPAGKYRFGVQSFLRYAPGNVSGKWYDVKGAPTEHEGVSGYDNYIAGGEDPDKFVFIYATNGTDETGMKPLNKMDAESMKADCFYETKNIMSMFDEKLEVYPENEPTVAEEGYVDEFGYGWHDSGIEYQAAKIFVNNPDLYRNYVEFELPEETTVWMGLAIEKRPQLDGTNTQYWNPARDFTLDVLAESAGVEDIVGDANAPVEYYNLQGVRVANPANGIFIVKKGNKTSKQIFR